MANVRTPSGNLTPTQAAKILGCSPYLVWKFAAFGHLKIVSRPGFPDMFDYESVAAHATLMNPEPVRRKRTTAHM